MAEEQQQDRREKWWGVAKAVAYELRPFTLPTKGDLRNAVDSVVTNSQQLGAEARRLAPEIVGLAKGVNPLRALMVLTWLCGWAGFIWLEFGAVYFIVSSIVMIFVNLGEREEDEWSAYSVFNAGCRALLGTINAEQFEREIMRQNPAGPDHDQDEYVWVEPPGARDAAAEAAAIAAGDSNDESDGNNNGNDSDDQEGSGAEDAGNGEGAGGGGGGGGAGGGGAARAGRKVSGKRARRGFEDRRERREERRLALEAFGHEE